MIFFKVENVGIDYPDFQLKDVAFQMKKGERLSILGLSGSGKTTLLALIYGLIDSDSGKIIFNDEEVLGPSKVLIPGCKGMKLVNQDYALDNYHKVKENISNKILHYEKEEITSITDELLNVINLKDYEDQQVYTLSGGQKQRLALGRSLAELPGLLLLDEPFSQIDLMNKFQIEKKLMDYLQDNEIASIMVTHHYQDAFAFSDRVLIMKDGQLLRDTSKKDLYLNPRSHYEAMLTGGYNRISIEKVIFDFRKNEFSLTETGDFNKEIKIEEISRINLGAIELIECQTELGEWIALESSFELDKLHYIYIKNKRYSFEN